MAQHGHGLLDRQNSVLVVIDIQERLLGAMPEQPRKQLLKNTGILIEAAGELDIPVLHTEQYPKGLGKTDTRLQAALPDRTAHEKTCFSCQQAKSFAEALAGLKHRQVVLTGMESHVCVLQTAIELRQAGYTVFAVEDAMASRRHSHHKNALQRLPQNDVDISNVESVLFEWLRDASHPAFKMLSALIR